MIGSYMPLIVFGVLLLAGIVGGTIWKVRMSRAEARRWTSSE